MGHGRGRRRMGKPVIGEVVVLPFPQTDLQAGKRRPALVVADLAGEDLILCQITTQSRRDSYSVPLSTTDFERGRLNVDSFVRANRLFTVDHSVIIYTAAMVKSSKLDEVRARIRRLLVDYYSCERFFHCHSPAVTSAGRRWPNWRAKRHSWPRWCASWATK